MSQEILSSEDYIKILQDYYKYQDIVFKDAEWSPASKDVQGFMGEHYNLKLNYSVPPSFHPHSATVFVKTKPRKNDYQKEAVENLSIVYKKEAFLYNFLFKEYERMGYYTRFAPRAYFLKGEDTIVMENLRHHGYEVRDRAKFYDLDHCHELLKALAYFHANYLAFEETKSAELERCYRINQEFPEIFEEILYKERDTESIGAKYLASSIPCMLALIRTMPEDQDWKDNLSKKLSTFDYVKVMDEPLPYRKTCGHGDLWCNNMLFQYLSSNHTPTNCRLVDFQCLRYMHPAFDVLLSLHSNTRKSLRDLHLPDLLQYYYDTFQFTLKSYGHDPSQILPKEHFYKTCEFFKAVAVMQSICGRTMTHIPVEITNEAVNSGGDRLGDIVETEGRVGLILEACRRNDVTRELMHEDLRDLNDHL